MFPIVSDSVQWSSVFRSAPRPQHEGVDIFAPYGSDVVAVDDGLVRSALEKRGGLAVYLLTKDRTQYYFAHLSETVGVFPRRVAVGEVIGKVGTSGNAEGTPPHVHFEVRPKGGEKVDPAPLLDALTGRVPRAEELPVVVPRPTVPRSSLNTGTGWLLVLLLWSVMGGKGRA